MSSMIAGLNDVFDDAIDDAGVTPEQMAAQLGSGSSLAYTPALAKDKAGGVAKYYKMEAGEFGFIILPNIFPRTKRALEQLQSGKPDWSVEPLTDLEMDMMSKTRGHHSKVIEGTASLPFILTFHYGQQTEPTFVHSSETAALYPGIWPELEDTTLHPKYYERVLKHTKEAQLAAIARSGDPKPFIWAQEEKLVNGEKVKTFKHPNSVAAVNAVERGIIGYAYVLPIRKESGKLLLPQIMPIKVPTRKPKKGLSPAMFITAAATKAAKKGFLDLQNLGAPILYIGSKTVGDEKNPKNTTDYQQGAFYPLNGDASELQEFLESKGIAADELQEHLNSVCAKYIATNPLHKRIYFASKQEELKALNVALIPQGYSYKVVQKETVDGGFEDLLQKTAIGNVEMSEGFAEDDDETEVEEPEEEASQPQRSRFPAQSQGIQITESLLDDKTLGTIVAILNNSKVLTPDAKQALAEAVDITRPGTWEAALADQQFDDDDAKTTLIELLLADKPYFV